MAIHDTEEEQLEQLKKWWEHNQSSILAGVVGSIVVVGGVNFWQRHQLEQRTEASQMYQELLDSAAKNNNTESVEKIAEKLSTDFDSSAYADYAALQLAKVMVQKGDLDGAKALLEKEVTRAEPELKHVARLRLIQLMLASKQYEEGLKLIAEVDPASTEGFSASYDELQGDLYVAMDRPDEARNAYQSAIRTGQATPLVQFKLDDIATPAFNQAAVK